MPLTIIATPIGNLKDITLRALETLQAVDGVICEDSRRTGLLLHHYQINKPLQVLNDYNEAQMVPKIIAQLKNGQHLALVSDAGTPLIADPGYKLVRECLKEAVPVDSLPGPVSAIVALTLSGLPPDKFFFLGYLPEKMGKRRSLLTSLKKVNEVVKTTYVAFVSPHKLQKTLQDIQETLGDIEVVLAAELTKMHQRVIKNKVSQILTDKSPKGEYVLLFNFR